MIIDLIEKRLESELLIQIFQDEENIHIGIGIATISMNIKDFKETLEILNSIKNKVKI